MEVELRPGLKAVECVLSQITSIDRGPTHVGTLPFIPLGFTVPGEGLEEGGQSSIPGKTLRVRHGTRTGLRAGQA